MNILKKMKDFVTGNKDVPSVGVAINSAAGTGEKVKEEIHKKAPKVKLKKAKTSIKKKKKKK